MEDAQRLTPPVPFWIVAILSLIWNGYGGYDYVMVHLRVSHYIAQYPPVIIQLLDALPLWVTAAWAVGVWGAIAGSILLLMRSHFAVAAFGFSLLGLTGRTAYELSLDVPTTVQVSGMEAMAVIIWLIAVLLFAYSIRWRRAGLLR